MIPTKEDFLKAYNDNAPNSFTKWVFKYFSKETVDKDRWLTKALQWTGLSAVVLGIMGTALNLSRTFIAIPTFLVCVILIFIAILMISAKTMNNFRIRKIKKILGINTEEYNSSIKLYLE